MDLGTKMKSPYLAQPDTVKYTHVGSGRGPLKGCSFALSSMQGWRATQEDAHAHLLPTNKNPNLAFFGVFDGHGGDQAAIFAAKFVLTFIEHTDSYAKIDARDPNPHLLKQAIMEGFIDCDEDLRTIPSFANGFDFSGSTGTCCFITPNYIITGNTGDSRQALCSADKLRFSTYDHKPEDKDETARVEAAGGFVKNERVNGDLASARSFGDFRYKRNPHLPPAKQQVTVLPESHIIPRKAEDQFLILACDGIWDVMSNLEAIQYVLSAMRKGLGLAKICEMILDECLRKSSGDNMSIMIVAFPGAPEEMGSYQGRKPISSHSVREGIVDALL